MNIKWVNKEVDEWMAAGCGTRLFIEPKKYKWDTFWGRICHAKIGYFLHILGYEIGWHTSLIFDPLHSGGFFSHMRTFFWNLWHCDIWWPICNKVDRWRRPAYYQMKDQFDDACIQAIREGYEDKIEMEVNGLPNVRGAILGERFFGRVKELMERKPN